MKINFMIGLVILSIAIILSVLGKEFYTHQKAVEAGLQQCVVNIDGKNQVIWTKECQG